MATKMIVMRPYTEAAAAAAVKVTRSRVFPLIQSVKPSSTTISVAVSQSAKRVSCNGESSYLRTGTRIGTRNRNGNNGYERLRGGGGGGGGRRFSTGVGNSGSIDSPLIQSMEIKIKEHLNADLVSVKDAYGDGRHVSIDVISSAFEGQSAVNRQRMVYKAIWEELQNTVHAVDQMTTKTPSEAAANQ